jgi:DNA-binding MarR family transcriptional regulator
MQVSDRTDLLGELCTSLVRRLRFLERSELSCCGIPMSQAMVLQSLKNGGLRMSAIAEVLGVTQSTATRLVGPLVGQGRVERIPAPDDGRSVLIVLTDKGRRSATELEYLSRRWSENVMERIPTGQQESVIEAIQTVLNAVSECCGGVCPTHLPKETES